MREALFLSPTPPPAADLAGDAATSGDPTSAGPSKRNSAAPVSRASALPETGTEMDIGMDEEEDFEAMIAAAEEEATAAQSAITAIGKKASLPPTNDNDEEEDYEAMIAAAEAEAEEAHRGAAVAVTTNGTNVEKAKVLESGADEYEDDWAAMDGL